MVLAVVSADCKMSENYRGHSSNFSASHDRMARLRMHAVKNFSGGAFGSELRAAGGQLVKASLHHPLFSESGWD
jgi:hypothetical protein